MSKNDINQNGIKYNVSRHILFGILAGIITAIGISGISNISAQEMNSTTNNETSQMQEKVNLTGTIDVKSTIGEAFKSKVTVNILDAINAAQTNVGANSFVKQAELTPAHGYLVYKIMVVDENMKKYKVIVDPGNGQVLMKKEVTWYDDDEEHKMKYGEEKYNKDIHDDDYDQIKMMKMTKDEKY